MNYTPGIRVRIIEDCRVGKRATGEEGIYEGRFLYEGRFENPRIRLDNGDVIWGVECWWEPLENAPSLDVSQASLAKYKTEIFKELTDE